MLPTNTPIHDKGTSPHPTMNRITISNNGITKLLNNINPRKASGPDEIHGKILNESSTTIAPILKWIFEKSLNLGEVPCDWLHANVCPPRVQKRG